MSRIYSVPWQATVTSAGGDTVLWELVPATQQPIKLRGFVLSQISEVGDAAEEGLRISITRFPATVTSGNGTSVTPVKLDSADVAAGFTAEYNGTTPTSTSGTSVIVAEYGWNIRNSPYEIWFPDPAFAPKAKNAEALSIIMQNTLADDMTFCGTAWIEEE